MVCSLCEREGDGSFSLETRVFLCKGCELVVERFLERVPVDVTTPCGFDDCQCSCHYEEFTIFYGT